MATVNAGRHLIGAGLQFRGLVPYRHGWEHGGMQTDMDGAGD